MNWNEMSDFEVDVKTADLLGVKWASNPDRSENNQWIYSNKQSTTDDEYVMLPSYCNSWADMGPLIEEHAISLEPLFNGGWYAGIIKTYTFNESPLEFAHDTCNQNPLRAAAICLIKKLEAEQ